MSYIYIYRYIDIYRSC